MKLFYNCANSFISQKIIRKLEVWITAKKRQKFSAVWPIGKFDWFCEKQGSSIHRKKAIIYHLVQSFGDFGLSGFQRKDQDALILYWTVLFKWRGVLWAPDGRIIRMERCKF